MSLAAKSEFCAEYHGRPIAVSCCSAELRDSLLARLPADCRVTPAVPGGLDSQALDLEISRSGDYITVRSSYAAPVVVKDLATAVMAAENSLDILFALRSSPEHLFIHAGAVEWQGKAYLFPGYSRSGKSTLVKTCLENGAHYLAGDFAILRSDGKLAPCRKPLALRAGTEQVFVHPEELGSRYCGEPVELAAIVFADYRPGAGPWRPQRWSPGVAAAELLKHIPKSDSSIKKSLEFLKHVVLSRTIWAGAREEAFEVWNWIRTTVSREAQ